MRGRLPPAGLASGISCRSNAEDPAELPVRSGAFLRPSRADPGKGVQRWDLHRALCLSSGCCKKIPWPGWLAKTRNVFLRVPKNGKSKLRSPASSMGSARLLLVHRRPRFAVPCFIPEAGEPADRMGTETLRWCGWESPQRGSAKWFQVLSGICS